MSLLLGPVAYWPKVSAKSDYSVELQVDPGDGIAALHSALRPLWCATPSQEASIVHLILTVWDLETGWGQT